MCKSLLDRKVEVTWHFHHGLLKNMIPTIDEKLQSFLKEISHRRKAITDTGVL